MYQKLYKTTKIGRIASLLAIAMFLSACGTLGSHCHGDDCHEHGSDYGSQQGVRAAVQPAGLLVGAVVNANGRSELASYERWRYADQIASRILEANPELSGNIDSYAYMSKRVGAPFGPLLQSYRLEGDLSARALEALKSAQLRRRYLMMVSILPYEQSFPLKPDMQPVVGKLNSEVQDYYDLNRKTILLTAVRVQVYDTVAGRKVSDKIVRSDDGGRMLATENRSRKYVGNSLLASISNSLTNEIGGSIGAYPDAPKRDDVLGHIWKSIAGQLPGEIF